MKSITKIGISIGDVNGIGLEILGKYLNSLEFQQISKKVEIVIFCNYKTISEYFRLMENGKELLNNFQRLLEKNSIRLEEIDIEPNIEFGKVSKVAGSLALESIKCALSSTKKQQVEAMVTLPICKEAIQANLPSFIGHTEYISKHFPKSEPLMLFVHKNLRLAILTTHLPLKIVAKKITSKLLVKKIENMYRTLTEDFKIQQPKIAILGLNPHSGEDGLLGKEEIETFKPVINYYKTQKINLEGPFPADGFFAFGIYKKYDGILACYHDQGLIPFKILSKGKGVNFTANLPIVRTSPDHGTAFDIAGKNLADFKSLKNAISLAIKISKCRKKREKIKLLA
ncbi:MAG: 4-hydroxythreonine-4-phosphate dehydrogenase PdxA [Ignavibacteria bacterium]|nr:4-hydroxythreonine-4-phosphate dehydrogenase PdxA [Ignavibacteria bacterium]